MTTTITISADDLGKIAAGLFFTMLYFSFAVHEIGRNPRRGKSKGHALARDIAAILVALWLEYWTIYGLQNFFL